MVERVRSVLHKNMANGQKHFVKGHERRAGRIKGVPNKMPRSLKELVLLAGEYEGSNGKGKDGLLGYLRWLSRKEPKSFTTLLARILPLQVHATGQVSFNLIEAGISDKDAVALWVDTMQNLHGKLTEEGMRLPPLIEHDETEH